MKFRILSVLGGVFLWTTGALAQSASSGGFVDPAAANTAQSGAVSVVQAKGLRDDAPVILRGNIVRVLGDEKYLFQDKTGSVIVEIDDDLWRGQTITPNDHVEIRGEVDRDWGAVVEIEANFLTKL